MSEFSILCRVHCADSTEYTLYSCLKAKLVEVNEKLLERPQLLQEKVNSQILILRYSQTKQIISLFPIVFATLQLPVSLEPIDQFQWGLL